MRQRVDIDRVDFAVDEHIWGHRLYDEQLPHLAVLEFLGVLGSNPESPLIVTPDEKVRYRPQQQISLRGLLFNNPYVEAVRERAITDEEKWHEWGVLFAQDATKHGDEDMAYLRRHLPASTISPKPSNCCGRRPLKLGATSVGARSSSFPLAPTRCTKICALTRVGLNDRRFFARTGELLYLMLVAHPGPELGEQLAERLFDARRR